MLRLPSGVVGPEIDPEFLLELLEVGHEKRRVGGVTLEEVRLEPLQGRPLEIGNGVGDFFLIRLESLGMGLEDKLELGEE